MTSRTYADGLPTLTMGLMNFSREPQDWSSFLELARVADDAGVDRIVVVDHVVMSVHIENYDGGRFPTGPDGQWLEPFTTMSVIAGMTSNVRLSTGIILAGLRRPVVFAKSLATLDVLSGGRVDLGVGVGWQKEEYDAAGLPFAERGRILDETLELCQLFWSESPAAYQRDGLEFAQIWCEPKPLQPGGVPFWVSGRLNRNVINRIVRYGSGWIPWGEWAGDVEHGIEVLRDAFAAAGREWDGFEVRGGIPVKTRDDGSIDMDASLAGVPAQVAAGVTDFSVNARLAADPDDARAMLGDIVSAFRAVVGRS
jgi:probable F420-dependent oxidoreductase